MQMMYVRENNEVVEYSLAIDPPEAILWTTYKIKKHDIRLAKSYGRSETAELKQEILDDICASEGGNPPRKHPLQEECEDADGHDVQVRRKQQKTRRTRN
jgi:hypothetical protein